MNAIALYLTMFCINSCLVLEPTPTLDPQVVSQEVKKDKVPRERSLLKKIKERRESRKKERKIEINISFEVKSVSV